MYFREDKTGASMTHTMFDDQQVSTFVGQWNCFPGPDGCIALITNIFYYLYVLFQHLITLPVIYIYMYTCTCMYYMYIYIYFFCILNAYNSVLNRRKNNKVLS